MSATSVPLCEQPAARPSRVAMFIDRVMVPAGLVMTFPWGALLHPTLLFQGESGWMGATATVLDKLLRPAILALLLLSSRRPRAAVVTLPALIGIGLMVVAAIFVARPRFGAGALTLFGPALLFYVLLGLGAIVSLGRNIAFLPGLREVVDTGPYRLVRHPMMSALIHLLIAATILHPVATNFAALACMLAGALLRAREEEALLRADERYRRLEAEVPARFFATPVTGPVILLAYGILCAEACARGGVN